MKRVLLALMIVALLLTSATGCRTLFGRGRGPIQSLSFLPQHNPELTAPVSGAINERREPKEVMVVVPPGTDVRALVATIMLNTEADVAVISSGQRVPQRNGVTPNDFTLPLMYSIQVPGESEPWLYRVTVREADTEARLAALQVVDALRFEPRFSVADYHYSAEVPFSSRNVRIDARGQSAYLRRIMVDGTPIHGAAGSVSVGFEGADRREIAIETLAEDGVTREQYSLTLLRAAPDRNAALDALAVSGATLSPVFDTNRLHYTTELPFSAQDAVVTARPQSGLATVTIEPGVAGISLAVAGDPASARGATVAFSGTDRLPLVIAVRAEDGTLLRYTLDVRRAAPPLSAAAADPAAGPPPPVEPVAQPVVPDTPETSVPQAASSVAAPAAAAVEREPAVPVPPESSSEVIPPGPPVAAARPGSVSMQFSIAARSLQLRSRETAALGGDDILEYGTVTLRRYRSDELLAEERFAVGVQRRGGRPPVVRFEWRSAAAVSAVEGGLIEVEVALPTDSGAYLHYTEAVTAAAAVTIDIPFLLLSDNPRVSWPQVGSPVMVDGLFSMIPPGQIARRNVEELPRAVGLAAGAQLTVRDGAAGSQLFNDRVWSGSGVRAGQQLSFDRAVRLEEGRAVDYEMEVRGPDGRGWRANGATTVWTTRIAYEGGFRPALLFVME